MNDIETEERMTVKTVDICNCGLVMHQLNLDDYDTGGADKCVCCSHCGNEDFQTIEQLQADLKTIKANIKEYGKCRHATAMIDNVSKDK